MCWFAVCLLALLPAASLHSPEQSTGVWSLQGLTKWNRAFHDGVRSFILSTTGQDLEKIMSRCYDRFGCFSIYGPWKNDLTRPVSLFPLAPEVIMPKYCLYTRRSPLDCESLLIDDPSSIYRSSYVPRGQVYFIAHGFIESGNRPWVKKMTAELVKRSSCNVIVIDWQNGANPPYSQAVANVRLVGVMTAHLINVLVREMVGLKAEKIHVIGHSLGAHLASYIGTALRTSFGMRLGRISGLDPAEPHFGETDKMVRLDPSDALFVDNIHTDAGSLIGFSLGMVAPVGHVDFYPNGGRYQPGCPRTPFEHMEREKSFTGSVRNYLNCDHTRSYLYFIETINKELPTTAVECTSWDEYLNGSCFDCQPDKHGISRCIPMGFHAISAFLPTNVAKKRAIGGDPMLTEPPKSRFRQMYSTTSQSSPYYLSQYKVSITVANDTRDAGSFAINIVGEDAETGYLPLDRIKYMDEGSVQTQVVAGPRVGTPVTAVLKWSTSGLSSWRLNLPQFTIHLVTVQAIDYTSSLNLCAPTTLKAGYPVTLKPCERRRRRR